MKLTKTKDSETGPEPKDSGRTARRRRILRFGAVLILIAGIWAGISYYRHAVAHESTDDAFVDGHISQVSPRVSGHIVAVRVTDNQWVEKGDLLVELDPADYRIQLDAALAELKSAEAAARIRDVDVDLSDIASRSSFEDARAEEQTASANVALARAQVETAKGRTQEIRIRIKTAELELELVKAQADAARADHVRNLSDLERYRKMAESETVSRQQVEHMEAAAQVSEANLAAAIKKIGTQETVIQQYRASLETALNQLAQAKVQVKASLSGLDRARAGVMAAQAGPKHVDQSRTRISSAEADIEKAQAHVAQARLNLDHTRIVAETSGFVSHRNAEPGIFVRQGQALMALVSDQMWVTANFKETQLAKIRPGQSVDIRIDTYPDLLLKGRVDSIQHGTGSRFSLLPSENATGNFVKVVQRIPVKILLEKTSDMGDRHIMPGMSVVPEVHVSGAAPITLGSRADPAGDRIAEKK